MLSSPGGSAPDVPGHIAIVMDGNGRWARARNRPRSFGHQAGLKALSATLEHCARLGVGTLTVFAFSSENWNRPEGEVSRLMDLFLGALDKEVAELHANDVRIRFIGERSAFRPALQEKMSEAEALTLNNERLVVNVAVNYGGRWDIVQAALRMAESVAQGDLRAAEVDETVDGSGDRIVDASSDKIVTLSSTQLTPQVIK